MGECRFESPYDGYGGVFCKVHDGDTPALCAHAAADLERRVKAQATSIRACQQVIRALKYEPLVYETQSPMELEAQAIQAQVKAGLGLPPDAHGDNIGLAISSLKQHLAQAEAREAALQKALEAYGRAANKFIGKVNSGRASSVETYNDLMECNSLAAAALSPDAGRVPVVEMGANFEAVGFYPYPSQELVRLREVARADCPKDWYRAQEIHEWLKREGWPTFGDLPVFLATHLQKALEKGWQLRDALAKRGEEGEDA